MYRHLIWGGVDSWGVGGEFLLHDWGQYLPDIFTRYGITRRSGRYAPILLAPAEGWGPFGPLGALRALLGAFGPQ